MKSASKNDSSKKNAGYKAAEYVKDGMVLGLGTGSTTHYFIEQSSVFGFDIGRYSPISHAHSSNIYCDYNK